MSNYCEMSVFVLVGFAHSRCKVLRIQRTAVVAFLRNRSLKQDPFCVFECVW